MRLKLRKLSFSSHRFDGRLFHTRVPAAAKLLVYLYRISVISVSVQLYQNNISNYEILSIR